MQEAVLWCHLDVSPKKCKNIEYSELCCDFLIKSPGLTEMLEIYICAKENSPYFS